MANQASHTIPTSGISGLLLLTLEKVDEHRIPNFLDRSKFFSFFQTKGDSNIRQVYQKTVKGQHNDRSTLLLSLGSMKNKMDVHC